MDEVPTLLSHDWTRIAVHPAFDAQAARAGARAGTGPAPFLDHQIARPLDAAVAVHAEEPIPHQFLDGGRARVFR